MFDQVVSLGPLCTPAWRAKAVGLRRAAFPFDWVFVDAATVARLVTEEGAWDLYMDWAALVERRSPHFPELIFNHLDTGNADEVAQYERAVARWRALLADPSQCPLFVYGGVRARVEDLPTLRLVHAHLCKALPGCGVLVVTCERAAVLGVTVREVNGSFFHVHMTTPHWEYNWHMNAEAGLWAHVWRQFA
jgi:hypothetical protein